MAAVKRDKCVHQFLATARKGSMEVECFSLNKRGKAQKVMISATVFKCSLCGAVQEYPDLWEKNFRMPAGREKHAAVLPGKKKAAGA